MSTTRKAYQGLFRKMVIAFDVGTTYSGASYAVLDPGLPPVIEGVSKFLGQGKVGGDSKIPSIIYYDQDGNVRAVGAEATENSFLEEAEDEKYIGVEWFKLHLRPSGLEKSDESQARVRTSDLPPLPPNKKPIDIFADFLRYLHKCTINFIKENRGAEFFSSVEHEIEYVLSHPNGWEGAQQAQMRQAAISAGLVSADEADSRLQFVTEGEASLHYCINKGVMRDVDDDGQKGFIIVDAGGGTIDVSAYRKSGSGRFEEITKTQCRLQGSVYVTRRATSWIESKLKNSKYGTRQDIVQMANVFDRATKLCFRNEADTGYIHFGSPRDRDLSVGINRGQMKIPGEAMKLFFTPSVEEILEAVQEQMKEVEKHTPISSVFLVGGFAASDYLFSTLQTSLNQLNLSFYRPDGFLNKAVADGAVSFYLDHRVSARVARFTYGIQCRTYYLPFDPEHVKRRSTVFTNLEGEEMLPGYFTHILPKGTRVHEETDFREGYARRSLSAAALRRISVNILHYRGHGDAPHWLDVDPKRFPALCTIEADIPESDNFTRQRYNTNTGEYHDCTFEVVLLFGLTELKAQIAWEVDGEEKRSPATVVYDQNEVQRD
ncbi:hypothetical protein AAF712_008952 [Marasmius tenuissimus]|uniref:Uncharacterized protein n=1 Tax=Marasmius tenuissimus TaxID=585030 RepID=A0ABR2ZUV4_9AGAR